MASSDGGEGREGGEGGIPSVAFFEVGNSLMKDDVTHPTIPASRVSNNPACHQVDHIRKLFK